jgi:carboxylesterase type B
MKLSSHALINISASIFSLLSSIAATAVSSAPVVDLGYALHKATISAVTLLYTSKPSVAETHRKTYFTFPNIRYAAPPLDSLRFSSPQPPLNNRSAGIQNGSYGKICSQGTPFWSNASLANAHVGPTESEDCLFLDVTVSQTTFKQGAAPVIVWIHGGGYIMRNKAEGGSPIGLLERSAEHTEGSLFVAIAYRVLIPTTT